MKNLIFISLIFISFYSRSQNHYDALLEKYPEVIKHVKSKYDIVNEYTFDNNVTIVIQAIDSFGLTHDYKIVSKSQQCILEFHEVYDLSWAPDTLFNDVPIGFRKEIHFDDYKIVYKVEQTKECFKLTKYVAILDDH